MNYVQGGKIFYILKVFIMWQSPFKISGSSIEDVLSLRSLNRIESWVKFSVWGGWIKMEISLYWNWVEAELGNKENHEVWQLPT